MRLSEHFQTIRPKIAAALFAVLAVSIAITMFGVWTYGRDRFIERSNAEAIRGGHTIEKVLRTAMLENDRAVIQREVNEIAAIYEPPSRISIININGEIAVSSDPALIGRSYDRFTSSSCNTCHLERGIKPDKTAIIINEGQSSLLRNIIKINNQPQCHQCHPASTKILGILMYDASFTSTLNLLKNVAFRMFLTGMVTFLVISIILFLAINRLIHEPINRLMKGFTEVGTGNYDYWVEESSSTEFAYMGDQFNVMNRAIGRFINEIKSKNQETSILYGFVREVSETIEWERLKKIIIDLVHEIFNAEQVGLVIPRKKKKECVDILWRVKNEKRLASLTYCTGEGELLFNAVTVKELTEWHRDQLVSPRFIDNYQRLLIPLQYNKQPIGLICIQKKQEQSFSRDERVIIPALSNHVAISLANSQLYHMAITDGLTGLYSKRHMFIKIDMMVAGDREYSGDHFFVLMMDLDHFKEVNDTYGHEVGDQVLIQLAEVMKKNIRYEDIPFRYGGEEFIVVVPATSADSTPDLGMEIAERLRAAVENHAFECGDEIPPLQKTISIGVALFPTHGKTSHEIIRAADEALYEAKNSGRNRVCSATLVDENDTVSKS